MFDCGGGSEIGNENCEWIGSQIKLSCGCCQSLQIHGGSEKSKLFEV